MMANKNLCIMGMAPSWRHSPFGVEGWDIWGMNHLFLRMSDRQMESITAWFELHHPDDFNDSAMERKLWLGRSHPFPVYMHNEEVAEDYGQQVFPRTKIERGFRRGYYHASSYDWLLAMALLSEYDQIAFYGMGSMIEGEPLSARPCLEYWVGLAEARGVEVDVPDDSDLLFNVEQRGGQYAYTRNPDGLGALYLSGGINWQEASEIGAGVRVGRSAIGPSSEMVFIGFPAWKHGAERRE